jgi:hypothetical protein
VLAGREGYPAAFLVSAGCVATALAVLALSPDGRAPRRRGMRGAPGP